MRILKYLVAVMLIGAAAAFFAIGYHQARADPEVRRVSLTLPDWPAGVAPVRVVLGSDIHLESWAMDGARLNRIVRQINALKPDLVVLAGDFIEGRDAREPTTVGPALVGALGKLRAPLGTVAVLGNHDYWTNAPDVLRLLKQGNVRVLRNEALAVGPLVIGGVDDDSTNKDRLGKTLDAMATLPGARLIVAHSPHIAVKMLARKSDHPALLLAGHTHCGQVMLPWFGPPVDVVEPHYRCGVVRDPGLTTIVTAGLGTSELPIRIGVPPDLWVITLGPATHR